MPVSTYRLQLNRDFRFRDAAGIVDYLDRLGITDCYVSPVFQARPGSLHGYDVTDHAQLNPDLGTEEDFQQFGEALRARGMGLILDVVPNHMCIADPSSRWWWDVLENGPSSPYAQYFDIEWRSAKEELWGKVLLPILGDQYGRALEEQALQIVYIGGAFYAAYGDIRLPVAPRSWRLILEPASAAVRATLAPDHPAALELESILTALSYLPRQTETEESRTRERMREKEIIKRRLAELVGASGEVGNALEASLRQINGARGDPRSFDALEHLLSEQAYRLSYWRVAADEINYRRFFDINDLAAIRVEDPRVFAAVHERVFELVRKGYVTGLRIDHPDGLFEPAAYFETIQGAAREAGVPEDQRLFVVAEKILVGDEELRPWRIEGTTGYGFLNYLNGLFVDGQARRSFERLYRGFTGWSQDLEELFYDSKRTILRVSMSSELNVLARQLDRISEQHRWSRDFTLESLRFALREVVSCFPIYRTYVTAEASAVDAEDERHIRSAIAAVKRRNPATSESVFDFIQSLLLLEHPAGLDEAHKRERRLFVMRLQQFTGPVMAKGLEDTAFYRYHPLASLNEVGGDPLQFGVTPSFLHAKNRIRQRGWGNALLATSTHDSKRSEDVRARLNTLSEIPAEWFLTVKRWHHLNRRWKRALGGEEVPSRNEEYLLYQTLLGLWPAEPVSEQEHAGLVARIQLYMQKALREAKLHTSWINPNTGYESAVERFIDHLLDRSGDNPFLREFTPFCERVARAGMLNSLSQTLIKICSPGVPDFFQGNEIWNLCLVDPDNRRPVDFDLRRRLLAEMDQADETDPAALAPTLMQDLCKDSAKLYVTSRALRFRRANHPLFAKGGYTPLRPAGERRGHVFAFARCLGRQCAVVAAGRFFMAATSGWERSMLPLPRKLHGAYRDVFTGRVIPAERQNGRSCLPLEAVFASMPLALLEKAEE